MATGRAAYEPRTYRVDMHAGRLASFEVSYKETDLWIGVDPASSSKAVAVAALEEVTRIRHELEAYIGLDRRFLESFHPIDALPGAPGVAMTMIEAARAAGVGPMAAVAGAVAERVGRHLMDAHGVREVIVENGGDIFLHAAADTTLAVHAGPSPLSNKIGVVVPAHLMPLGVCTSSATVGPSISLGKTDATLIACHSAALADAYATRIANMVSSPADVEPALAEASRHPDVLHCLIIIGEILGVKGRLPLAVLKA